MTGNEERVFLSPPHLDGAEKELVAEVFDSNFVAPVGPMLSRFEKQFCDYTGIAHAAAVSSGTAAMHLALRALGVGAGDHVWTSTLNFIGGVAPIVYQGAEPVFLDVSRDTWTLDPDLLREELGLAAQAGCLPKAVVPVDLYGQCADLDAIEAVCAPYAIPVVVDAAEAMGATYKGRHAGKGARAAVFSFNGNKIITTGGGGMIASDDRDLVEFGRYLSQQAREPVPYYEHTTIGYNYRMSSLSAAVGCGQLQVLDERVAARRKIFERYRTELSGLPGVSFMPESRIGRTNRWLTVMLFDPNEARTTPDAVRTALEEMAIEARPVWKPMHLQPVFRGAKVLRGNISETLFERGLCLPSGTRMTCEQQSRVIDALKRVCVESR